MGFGLVVLILGVALGVGTLVSVKQINFLGSVCYYVGHFDPVTANCLQPGLYYSALGISLVVVLLGLVLMLRDSLAPKG
jgi:hypothetical protein